MAGVERNRLSAFLESGIYEFPNSNAVFIDPLRILNRKYSRFRVSPSAYYSRFFNPKFDSQPLQKEKDEAEKSRVSANSLKRKRNQQKKIKQHYALNEKELLAEQRHQDIRPFLVKAQEDLIGAKELLEVMCELNCEKEGWETCIDLNNGGVKEEVSFVELGKVWQAPFYEIAINISQINEEDEEDKASRNSQHNQKLLPIFNNLVLNETNDDVLAEFLTSQYVLPKDSSFYMSDLVQIHNLIPDDLDRGFNCILIDPPWENRSAYQKSMYPTLPNRYFLSIPIRQLTHARGALVALWVTNREKLRNFVENELFPAWGVRHVATWYWLKAKANGSLICDLDLFHHRPYECLLLGYCGRDQVVDSELPLVANTLKDKQVIVTIPGDYSRKPPVGDLLDALNCLREN
uniref:Site-specific DNA-methyltransferase (Adenine-specific) n=2 Tax=Opuntia streptacantha TaxID=393608 RepID=A0A7C9APA3_OPUST